MRAVLDACVLYPTTLRELLISVAKQGLFTPLWSERILQEWVRASERTHGPEGAVVAGGEIALLKAGWPNSILEYNSLPDLPDLPDANDQHVLEAAINGRADTIITLNLKDFPTRTLSPLGIAPRSPDSVLLELFATNPTQIGNLCDQAFDHISQFPKAPTTLRGLMKKANLPRLGKALVNRG